MNPAVEDELPSWIARLPRRPLCDVPWLGRSVVLSDGGVNFCCYSDAVVGNVNEHSLKEIWNGDAMRRIRDTLVKQRFPKECQSNSCPIFRGDQHSYLLDRMDGPRDPPEDGRPEPGHRVTRAVEREQLRASRLEIAPAKVRHGERLRIALHLANGGDWIAPDLFVGVTTPDGKQLFLPGFGDFPLPFARTVDLSAAAGVVSLAVVDAPLDRATPPGTYQLCAALFVADSNPNVAANCLWSTRGALVIGG